MVFLYARFGLWNWGKVIFYFINILGKYIFFKNISAQNS